MLSLSVFLSSPTCLSLLFWSDMLDIFIQKMPRPTGAVHLIIALTSDENQALENTGTVTFILYVFIKGE